MLRILHLEDSDGDAFFVKRTLASNGIEAEFVLVKRPDDFASALEQSRFDLILADNGLPGFSGLEALAMARQKFPEIGFICVSGSVREADALKSFKAGATDYVPKDHLWQLVLAIQREEERVRLVRSNQAKSRLVTAVQELSLARDLEAIIAVVRRAARELTGADGASFVLREGELCHYAEEDAIGPLWKGRKFPMQTCISGWVMLNRQPAVIEDIYADARIPADAYRPTFVKSLAMVPIRTEAPIGAIGNYWAARRMPTTEEVELLQALANTTAVAMENVRVYNELEERVKDRTAQLWTANSQLEAANRELESFSYAVSHDLGAPLRNVAMYTKLVQDEFGTALNEEGRGFLDRVLTNAEHMRALINDLLRLSRITRTELKRETVDLAALAGEIAAQLSAAAPERKVDAHIGDGMEVEGDRGLLRIALENLLSNAWKYTAKAADARIDFSVVSRPDGPPAFCVRDNGAGFDMKRAGKLFQPFQRLHSQDDFPGSGVGLATVQRIIHRHGGRVWAEAGVNKGAAFYFTLA